MTLTLGTRPSLTANRIQPALEGLEDRVTPATLGSLNLPLQVLDINVAGTPTAPQLQAIVSLAGRATDVVTMDLTTTDNPNDECPVLNLHLGEIDLNLLGLGVHTSEICLDITAVDHQGLLGSLICNLTDGLNLGGIIGGIGNQLNNLLDRLDTLLDGILGGPLTVTGVLGGASGPGAQQADHVCDILNLSLGPVNLDVPLLGVSVDLDNCAGGPVTVDVTGNPSGGILGSLLCGLADGIDLGHVNVGGLISRLDRLIDRLGDLAGALDRLPQLTHQIDHLIDQLERLADRVDNLADLDRLIDRIDHVIDRIDHVLDRAA